MGNYMQPSKPLLINDVHCKTMGCDGHIIKKWGYPRRCIETFMCNNGHVFKRRSCSDAWVTHNTTQCDHCEDLSQLG